MTALEQRCEDLKQENTLLRETLLSASETLLSTRAELKKVLTSISVILKEAGALAELDDQP